LFDRINSTLIYETGSKCPQSLDNIRIKDHLDIKIKTSARFQPSFPLSDTDRYENPLGLTFRHLILYKPLYLSPDKSQALSVSPKSNF
jgi:hypothetical protein